MQLHYFEPPDRSATPRPDGGGPRDSADLHAAISGTEHAPSGVTGLSRSEHDGDAGAREARPSRRTSRGVLWLALACSFLLGQGERCQVDPRFQSPSATLGTYWQALLDGDAETVWTCFDEARPNLPVPGMLWFLPPSDTLRLTNFRALPVASGRVMVRYEVEFIPRGVAEIHSFENADELVRRRGEWRITRSVGEVSYPEWQPTRRPVDS